MCTLLSVHWLISGHTPLDGHPPDEGQWLWSGHLGGRQLSFTESPLLPSKLITDHTHRLSIKYPPGEGWQVQGLGSQTLKPQPSPQEVKPGREEPRTQTPHHLAGSQGAFFCPYGSRTSLCHTLQTEDLPSWLLSRPIPPFGVPPHNGNQGKLRRNHSTEGLCEKLKPPS